jgi:hypothetical protein
MPVTPASVPRAPEWLVLVHQLPSGASNPRVKVWRRVLELGAVPLRSAVYVLPNSPQAREDFAWVREEINGLKGQATILTADTTDAVERQVIVDAFRTARGSDFASFTRDAERLARSLSKSANRSPEMRGRAERQLRAIRERLRALERIDFFAAPGADQARAALAKVEGQMPKRPTVAAALETGAVKPRDFRGRVWVTRPRPGVDRMASAWLIRRFIDPRAAFAFADHPRGTQIPFDMFTGEFSHYGSFCTFETMAQRFVLKDPAITRIGQIVHDLDMKEARYGLPEAVAVGHMVEGLRSLYAKDDVLLEHGITMFESLARSFGANAPDRAARGTQRKRRS